MRRFGAALVEGLDVVTAAERAAARAVEPLDGVRPDLVCAFVCTPEPDDVDGAARRVADVTGGGSVLGCSAGGVLADGRGLEGVSAVSVWAAVLPGARVRTFHLEVMRTPDSLAVVGLPHLAPDTSVCLLLADPYSFPADGFVARFNDTAAGVPIAGGLASGRLGAGSTRLILDGRAVGRGAVGALVEGPVPVHTLVSQGCRPVGPALTVTAAAGNTILELAGRSAVSRLEEIVQTLPAEDQALVSAGLHVGIAMNEYGDHLEHGDFLIRGVLGVDDERAGLVVGDLVDVGRTVRFHVRDADAAAADLEGVLARTPGLGSVEGALLFTCNGRGAALFPDAGHDVRALREHVAGVPVAGFFAAGEIGPVGGRNYLHGFTASIVAFGAADEDAGA